MTDENWQGKIRRYQVEGPGFVGAALDLPAATSTLLDLCVRRRTPKGPVVVKDDPLINAVMNLWCGETTDQKSLLGHLIRTLDGPGAGYMQADNQRARSKRICWNVLQTINVTDNRNGTTAIRTRPDARPGSPWYKEVPDRSLYHFLQSEPNWEGVPWSPLRRALPHIEDYRKAMRNVGRNLDSQLAMNGVFWAQRVKEDQKWMDDMESWADKGIRYDDTIASVLPFLLSTSGAKPEWVDVGRGSHDEQLSVANAAVRAFCQSSDLPTQWLEEGPGTGNHWGDFFIGDWYADYVLGPRWKRAVKIITETHLRPMLRALPATKGYNPEDWEVWADESRIRGKTDNTDRILEARRMGVAKAQAVADAVDLDPDQMIELPPGVSEYDQWLISLNPALANQAPQQGGEEFVGDRIAPGLVATNPGAPDQQPDLIAAAAEIEATLPAYWNELVPC